MSEDKELDKMIEEKAEKYPDPSISSGFIEGANFLATDLKALAMVPEIAELLEALSDGNFFCGSCDPCNRVKVAIKPFEDKS